MRPDLHPRFVRWFNESPADVQAAIRAKWDEFSKHPDIGSVAENAFAQWLAQQPRDVRDGTTPAGVEKRQAYQRTLDRKKRYATDTFTMKWAAETYGYGYGP